MDLDENLHEFACKLVCHHIYFLFFPQANFFIRTADSVKLIFECLSYHTMARFDRFCPANYRTFFIISKIRSVLTIKVIHWFKMANTLISLINVTSRLPILKNSILHKTKIHPAHLLISLQNFLQNLMKIFLTVILSYKSLP